jgi:uncharacterized protein
VPDFVSDPHTAILGKSQGEILNLVDTRAARAQQSLLTIAKEPGSNRATDRSATPQREKLYE